MRGTIVAYEGPSGSGKSYKLKQLEGRVIRRPNFSNERVHTPGFGAWSSSAQEYMCIAAATMEPDIPVYSDRFLLSRWVYRAIQSNKGYLSHEWKYEIIDSLRRMLSMASHDMCNRMDVAPGLYPEITINVRLPTLSTLNDYRGMSGKEYPFDGETELRLYRQVAEELRTDLLTINIH